MVDSKRQRLILNMELAVQAQLSNPKLPVTYYRHSTSPLRVQLPNHCSAWPRKISDSIDNFLVGIRRS